MQSMAGSKCYVLFAVYEVVRLKCVDYWSGSASLEFCIYFVFVIHTDL
jgi:hypothetical protein